MRQFFKFFFASMLGFIVGSFVLMLLLMLIIGGIAATFSKSDVMPVKDNSVLRLELNYDIPEKTDDNPLHGFSFSDFSTHRKPGLNDILANIKKAKDDSRIKGIFLDFGVFTNAAATGEQIRNALIDFKQSGKWVVSYSELLTQKAYFVESAADKVYLNPKGLMEFRGINAQIMFFKNMLDKLGVTPQVFYVGKFKTATEPFRYDKMSEPNKVMTLDLISHLQQHYTAEVAAARKLDAATVDSISNNLLIQSPFDALKYKMVDGVLYRDQVIDEMKQRLGLKDKDKMPFVTLDDYNDAGGGKKNEHLTDPKIAVLYAFGDIVDGKGKEGNIGSETMTKELRKLYDDDKIKAVVLRVNSPGGSALASDVIWREVSRLKTKKPVVVSMGDYAASGGYYISCNASKIVAMPNTLTGSIGVFGILPDLHGLSDKIGITFDGVKTGKYSDLGTLTRPVRPDEAMIIQRGVDTVYTDFLSCVSQGRNIPVNMVDSIAQGRVWTGEQAIKLGLVDTLGGLQTALDVAAKLANIKSYRTVDYPEPKESKLGNIMKALSDRNDDDDEVRMRLGVFYPYYKQLMLLNEMRGVQARMPFSMEIQ